MSSRSSGHLHCLAHPDVVKWLQLNVRTNTICRTRVNTAMHQEFGVGPLEALYLVDRSNESLAGMTYVINLTRAQMPPDCVATSGIIRALNRSI